MVDRSLDLYLLWLVLWFVVAVAQSPIPPLAPGVETAVLKDTGTVGGATSSVHHTLALQGVHQVGGVHGPVGEEGGRGGEDGTSSIPMYVSAGTYAVLPSPNFPSSPSPHE